MGLSIVKKSLLFWVIFLVMYGLYKFLPIFPLSLICATNESNFQHYKAGFFAYLFASLFEYILYRKKLDHGKNFPFSRLAATTFLPWIMFILWYIFPAVYGRMPWTVLEVVYANVITLLVGFFAAILEEGLETAQYSKRLRTILLVLFFVSMGLYLIFTFKMPWADVFVEPAWR